MEKFWVSLSCECKKNEEKRLCRWEIYIDGGNPKRFRFLDQPRIKTGFSFLTEEPRLISASFLIVTVKSRFTLAYLFCDNMKACFGPCDICTANLIVVTFVIGPEFWPNWIGPFEFAFDYYVVRSSK